MKLFGLDISAKWIDFELDEKHYSIHFNYSFFKGITGVEVYTESPTATEVKIKSVYPSFKRRCRDVGLMLPSCIRSAKLQQRNNPRL